tara:strand:+ start:236 stop:451 length:216 start_codon:yes stop_codon:yes gene_type:complete
MKKAIIVLVMIIGIFTSCEQDNPLYGCNCIETTYAEETITEQEYVECQEESIIETEGTTIEVRCNFVNIIK